MWWCCSPNSKAPSPPRVLPLSPKPYRRASTPQLRNPQCHPQSPLCLPFIAPCLSGTLVTLRRPHPTPKRPRSHVPRPRKSKLTLAPLWIRNAPSYILRPPVGAILACTGSGVNLIFKIPHFAKKWKFLYWVGVFRLHFVGLGRFQISSLMQQLHPLATLHARHLRYPAHVSPLLPCAWGMGGVGGGRCLLGGLLRACLLDGLLI